jgi:hypothetical protein
VCGTCRIHGEIKNAYKILVEGIEANRSLVRPRCRWEDNIKMELKQRGEQSNKPQVP